MVLEKSLVFIQGKLDTYLKHKAKENDNKKKVVLSNILKHNGEVAIGENQIGLTLVNVEEERIGKTQEAYQRRPNGSFQKSSPDIKLNLYILFVARFKNYDEGLKALSQVISFFQSRNVFDRSVFPAMDESLDQLIFELQTMSFEQMNHLWGALGAKYMPSLLYEMRMLTVREDEILGDLEPIKEYNIKGD